MGASGGRALVAARRADVLLQVSPACLKLTCKAAMPQRPRSSADSVLLPLCARVRALSVSASASSARTCYPLAIERRSGATLSSTTAALNDWPMLIQLLATSTPIPMCSRRVLHCCLHTGCASTRRLRCCAESWRCARTSCVAAAGAEWRLMGLTAERDACQERPCSCLCDVQDAAARARDSPAGSGSLRGDAASDV